MAAPLVRLIAHFHQATETLTGQCNVEFTRATCLPGLCARAQTTLAARTPGILLDQQAGRSSSPSNPAP